MQGCHSLSQKIFPEWPKISVSFLKSFIIKKTSCKAKEILNKHLIINKINNSEKTLKQDWLNLDLIKEKIVSEIFKFL